MKEIKIQKKPRNPISSRFVLFFMAWPLHLSSYSYFGQNWTKQVLTLPFPRLQPWVQRTTQPVHHILCQYLPYLFNLCLVLLFYLSIFSSQLQQESEWWAMQDLPQPPRLLFSLVRNIKISIISMIKFIVINMLWYHANLHFSQAVLSMICGSSDQTTKLRASVLRLRQQVIYSKNQSFNITAHKS